MIVSAPQKKGRPLRPPQVVATERKRSQTQFLAVRVQNERPEAEAKGNTDNDAEESDPHDKSLLVATGSRGSLGVGTRKDLTLFPAGRAPVKFLVRRFLAEPVKFKRQLCAERDRRTQVREQKAQIDLAELAVNFSQPAFEFLQGLRRHLLRTRNIGERKRRHLDELAQARR